MVTDWTFNLSLFLWKDCAMLLGTFSTRRVMATVAAVAAWAGSFAHAQEGLPDAINEFVQSDAESAGP